MQISRRECLALSSALPLLAHASSSAASAPEPAPAAASFPDRSSFFPQDGVYLDAGSRHPISIGARKAAQDYLARRSGDPAAERSNASRDLVRESFARLINADTDEIAFVQSTTTGEHLLLHALGLPERGAHIVTDTLHFFGSFPLYQALAEQGCRVTWLKPVDGRISPEQIEKAVGKDTRLVALSLVSTYNGFEHDLERVCEIAHARGALVYADIVHAAGCIPLDVKQSSVDFAACASYKWLMGDFGLGFLYARREAQAKLRRIQFGYYGMTNFHTHVYPLDPPAAEASDYAFKPGATGHFAFGTYSYVNEALLAHSLGYLLSRGVANIQAHAATLTDHLKRRLPAMGFEMVTPTESRAPIVTCVLPDAEKRLRPLLEAEKIRMTVTDNRFRITPSVFNDIEDIERTLFVLRSA